jgi:hypothetical protein
MAKRISMLPTVVVLMAVSITSQQASFTQQPVESHVVPLKTFSKLATDKRYETVSGDPAKAGAPFVIRIHAEAGFIIMPHTHLVDENIVVVEGSWALGMGARFNRDTLEPMEVGDYGFAPGKMPHFALSKSETIIQVHGIGPFMTQWVVPMYELVDKGVLLKTSAGDPGRPVATSPEGCFVLKLGDRVRGSHGDGVVIAAQCTPGELTQYRVEKPDGELFWAQRPELNTP